MFDEDEDIIFFLSFICNNFELLFKLFKDLHVDLDLMLFVIFVFSLLSLLSLLLLLQDWVEVDLSLLLLSIVIDVGLLLLLTNYIQKWN